MNYSIRKRQKIKKIIKAVLVVNFLALFFLVGRQAVSVYFLKKPGDILHPTINLEKKVREKLEDYQLSQGTDILIKPSMIILKIGQSQIFLAKSKDIDQQLKTLQAIINQDRMEGRKAKIIDLRYKNPIARY